MSKNWETVYKALYKAGKIDKTKVKAKKNGRLTAAEITEITGEK